MSFTLPKPQRRKKVFCTKNAPFPVPIGTQTDLPPSNGRWCYYVAYLVNGNIFVKHSGDMDQLYRMGFFGKGTLSRHHPQYDHKTQRINWPVDESDHQRFLKILSRRKYLRRAAWASLELSTCEEEIELPLANKAQEASTGQGHISYVDVKDSRSSEDRLSSVNDNKTDAEKHDAGCEISNEPTAKRIRLDEGFKSCQKWTAGDLETDPWSATTEKESAEFWTTPNMCTTDETANAEQVDQQPVRCDNSDDGLCSHQSETVAALTSQPDDCTQSSATTVDVTTTRLSEEVTLSVSPSLADTAERKLLLDAATDELLTSRVCSDSSSNVLATSAQQVVLDCIDRRCSISDDAGDLLVVADTDDSDLDATVDTRLPWQPVMKKDPYPVKEYLQLSMEEAFFLTYVLGCLVLYDENQVALTVEQMWQSFCEMEPDFLARYVVYHNFRSKGWVPKSGLKYGTDFVIYKEGPAFYHSTYSVLVKRVSSDCLTERHQGIGRTTTWTSLSAINRVTEQVAKNLMFCYVIEPNDLTDVEILSPASISRFRVQEVVVKRMMSKQEKDNAEYMMIP